MPFTGHLEELRSCLIISFVVVAITFLISFGFVEAIFSFLTAPLRSVRAPGLTLIGTGVSEAFFTKLKVAFIASFFLSSPVLLWQAWRFVAPGLYEHEKRYARRFVLFGTLFFLLGLSRPVSTSTRSAMPADLFSSARYSFFSELGSATK